MYCRFVILLLINVLAVMAVGSESHVLTLGNRNIKLDVDIQGGAIIRFEVDGSVNPFTWRVEQSEMPTNNQSGAVFQGHFLCTGRWGAPTDGEIAAGVPHNGQASRDRWEVVKQSENILEMKIDAPLDGVSIYRRMELNEVKRYVKVIEKVRNTTSAGRLFNMVQHATIGPHFLNEETMIETNATSGFMQHLSYPDPHRYAYSWPRAFDQRANKSIDLRRSDSPESYVSTHLFNDSVGWVSATSPRHQLTLLYVWKTREYPWLNVWQQYRDGKLWAKGLEFGTAGIGRSYQELLRHDTRFNGQNSFFYLDAGEVVTKSYICFLLTDFKKEDTAKCLKHIQ